MSFLEKHCPTFTRIILWLWESPTFVTWGNQAVSSLRFLLVTPLVLTRFNETEIAAWYLFASLNFFGVMVSNRLGLTYMRMFSHAMGGASDLSPIKEKRIIDQNGGPNWEVFERAYGTIGSLNLFVAVSNVLVACAMGWFGLQSFLEGYEQASVLWISFGLLQIGFLVNFVFQRYAVALKGMNYVAVVGRWAMVFSIISIVSGAIVLWLDFGMICLVVTMQFFSVLGVLRNKFILRHVENGRVARFKQHGFDREVFSWCWEPTWKGMLAYFTSIGVVQIGVIVFSRLGSLTEVASFLLTLRMVQTVLQISGAPFNSIQPKMGRMLAEGRLNELQKLYISRSGLVLILMGLGLAAVIGVGAPLLEFIGANANMLSKTHFFILSILILHQWFINYTGSICGVANNVILVWSGIVAALVSLCLLFIMSPGVSVVFVILACWLPRTLIFNIRAGLIGAKILELPPWLYLGKLYGYTLVSVAFVAVGCVSGDLFVVLIKTISSLI
jgi:hypothetical protein